MKSPQNPSESRRHHERKQTRMRIRWDHRRTQNEEGEIQDISPSGIFLAPLGTMPDHIRPDDPIWIVLQIDGMDCFLSAKVRWRGMSKEHGELGFGLEFDENSKKIAEDLYLHTAEDGVFFVPE